MVGDVVVGVGQVQREHEVVTTRQPTQMRKGLESAAALLHVLVDPTEIDDEPRLPLVPHDERA